MTLTITLPLRLVSEANAHEHWRVRQRRAKAQRDLLMVRLRHLVAPTGPVEVQIVRIAPRSLDTDNLPGSCKHVRDVVAWWLAGSPRVDGAIRWGRHDDDPRITWRYAQERGAPREYAVRVEVVG